MNKELCPNRYEIYQVFCQFVEALRIGQPKRIRNLCTEDCLADMSTVGSLVGVDAIVEALKWPGPELQIRKSAIQNLVIRNDGRIAQQSAYVTNIFAQDDGEQVYPFVFGGIYCNSYIKTENGWKLNHIRYDLSYEFGNNSYVKDHWTLLDYVIYHGHEPMINTELDAPWVVIPEDAEPYTDEEQIIDAWFKYAFGLDLGDYYLTKDAATDDIVLEFSSHKGHGVHRGMRAYNNFLKSIHHKESAIFHGVRVGVVKVTGDEAIIVTPRGEEQRLRNRIMNRDNIHSLFTTSVYYNTARKCEDGVWRINKMRYMIETHMSPIPDDQILQDEYLYGDGGSKWLK
ncbi:MAG: nuclear transport factor 2 family protein [Lachnospiraceae bacterium]|nr:nuclear transport factor 2 family protein [Lachnospiraceae bacterium]